MVHKFETFGIKDIPNFRSDFIIFSNHFLSRSNHLVQFRLHFPVFNVETVNYTMFC